ncbi:uncharacterized protein TRAVEDRAFT_54256 [Trametes versicolor FP-101664 SS1]|uniref:Uncharacterized protein n=1 Tax=Trametes versicolor (strain FP-101664) TaxID=717944 RepID=R7S803_TRAVS|nr:uncharacterized protein TRAVEDRAFT_54256 [Trametes versicolor FP-101664 SS1]EIW51830.1 hypothetical protein TRAVEDRAFT_54256 [Trametes versicolor FP-101664 SS1]
MATVTYALASVPSSLLSSLSSSSVRPVTYPLSAELGRVRVRSDAHPEPVSFASSFRPTRSLTSPPSRLLSRPALFVSTPSSTVVALSSEANPLDGESQRCGHRPRQDVVARRPQQQQPNRVSEGREEGREEGVDEHGSFMPFVSPPPLSFYTSVSSSHSPHSSSILHLHVLAERPVTTSPRLPPSPRRARPRPTVAVPRTVTHTRCARRMPIAYPLSALRDDRYATGASQTHTDEHGGPRLVRLTLDVSKTTPPVDRNGYRPPAAAVRAERIASVAKPILARPDATEPAQVRRPSTLWKRGHQAPQLREERTLQRR